MHNKSLEQLRARLVGKTIQAVDSATETESLFSITLTDHTCVRIHATDLGWWVEDTVSPGAVYRGLRGLFGDYGHHLYQIESQFNFEVPEPILQVTEDYVLIVSPTGREFRARAETEWEKKLLNQPIWLGHALRAGDMWSYCFQKSNSENGCPPELVLFSDQE